MMCDFLEENLNEIKKWLNADPQAFNWNELIKLACQIEGSYGPTAFNDCTKSAL